MAGDFGGVDVDEPEGRLVADLAAGAGDDLQWAGGGGLICALTVYVTGEDEVDSVVFEELGDLGAVAEFEDFEAEEFGGVAWMHVDGMAKA